jgi:cytochrome P450
MATREVKLREHVLAPGTATYIPVYAIHRHAQLWEQPDRFDPDRFRPDLAQQRDRYVYMPFGAGPRMCIGMTFALTEALAVLATLLPAVRLSLRPGYTPQMRLRVTLRPVGGMPMRLQRR